jgi:hypothetical protein
MEMALYRKADPYVITTIIIIILTLINHKYLIASSNLLALTVHRTPSPP